jgi:nucleotide-binding universal stress UspA family protein
VQERIEQETVRLRAGFPQVADCRTALVQWKEGDATRYSLHLDIRWPQHQTLISGARQRGSGDRRGVPGRPGAVKVAPMNAYRRILVAVDGSPAAAKGLREAVRLAKSEEAELCIFNVVDEYYAFATPEAAAAGIDLVPSLREGGKNILTKAQAQAEKQGIRSKTILRETVGGSAADAIVREAKKQRADLIVLGTHGRRGVRRLVLGSDAEQVVRTASVPVLLVRS